MAPTCSLACGLIGAWLVSSGQANLVGPSNVTRLKMARSEVERFFGLFGRGGGDDVSLDPIVKEEINRSVMDYPEVDPTEPTLIPSPLYNVSSTS